MSGGEDGPERPSAPETPSPEAPQEPTEPAAEDGVERASDEAAESGRPRLLPVWILLGAAALSGGAWAVMDNTGGDAPPPDASVPLITASAEPWKVRPDDPGGMEIPNQGTLIYETLTTADPEEAPERILPPPEEPLSPPQPETDRAEELAVAASGVKRDDGVPQPDAGGVEEQTLAPIEEASPQEPEAQTPDVGEETSLLEIETPMEPEPIDGALSPADLEAWPSSVVMPHPPKPGTLAAIQVDVAPLPDIDVAAAEELPALEPETLALIEELLEQDSGESSSPARQEYVGSVPLPLFKPVHAARAAPAEPPVERNTGIAPETTLEPEQSGSRTWRYVQLGAATARRPLEGHWEMLRQRHGDVLVGLSPLIMPVDSGDSGITYRLRAGPLSDAGAAQRVCAQLKERGLACFVPRD
ncbi:MAG: SPOR domain-containing protein [Rhodospirillales bacterium]|nr:SPOR domain-containing protein [Rhodospirillales bacterium]MDE0381879.1 SPOR domain-containing protein [Rhodospirillales bacterium]